MYTECDVATKICGYGYTKQEALDNLQFNIARHDVNKVPEWLLRKQENYSWCPTNNSLHINGKTAIVCKDNILTNVRTGKSVPLIDEPFSQFYTLYTILDDVSFEDFCITYAEAINKFFSGISTNVGMLQDFPDIRLGNMKDANVLHFAGDVIVCEVPYSNDILVCCIDKVSRITVPSDAKSIYMVSYALAEVGYRFNGKELCKNAKTNII